MCSIHKIVQKWFFFHSGTNEHIFISDKLNLLRGWVVGIGYTCCTRIRRSSKIPIGMRVVTIQHVQSGLFIAMKPTGEVNIWSFTPFHPSPFFNFHHIQTIFCYLAFIRKPKPSGLTYIALQILGLVVSVIDFQSGLYMMDDTLK